MHACQRFEYRHAGHSFAVETLDAPVVALGERWRSFFSNTQPDLALESTPASSITPGGPTTSCGMPKTCASDTY